MTRIRLLTHGCSLSNLPLFVADRCGFFADEGLRVRLATVERVDETLRLLAEGRSELGTAPFSTPLLHGTGDNPPVIVAGSGLRGVALLARAGIDAVADLRGRTVGTFRADPMELLLHDALAHHGVRPEELHIVHCSTLEDATERWCRGDLDAVTVAQPTVIRLQESGAHLLTDGTDVWGPEFPDTVLVASRRLIRGEPEVVVSAIRAMLRAERLIVDDPAEAVHYAAHLFPAFSVGELTTALQAQPSRIDVTPFTGWILDRWKSLGELGLVHAETPLPDNPFDLSLLAQAVAVHHPSPRS